MGSEKRCGLRLRWRAAWTILRGGSAVWGVWFQWTPHGGWQHVGHYGRIMVTDCRFDYGGSMHPWSANPWIEADMLAEGLAQEERRYGR